MSVSLVASRPQGSAFTHVNGIPHSSLHTPFSRSLHVSTELNRLDLSMHAMFFPLGAFSHAAHEMSSALPVFEALPISYNPYA